MVDAVLRNGGACQFGQPHLHHLGSSHSLCGSFLRLSGDFRGFHNLVLLSERQAVSFSSVTHSYSGRTVEKLLQQLSTPTSLSVLYLPGVRANEARYQRIDEAAFHGDSAGLSKTFSTLSEKELKWLKRFYCSCGEIFVRLVITSKRSLVSSSISGRCVARTWWLLHRSVFTNSRTLKIAVGWRSLLVFANQWPGCEIPCAPFWESVTQSVLFRGKSKKTWWFTWSKNLNRVFKKCKEML